MLPSTHPVPVLFPPTGQPLSAVGLFCCSPCYPVVSLFTLVGQPFDRRDEWCRSDLYCNLFEFLFRGGCLMLAQCSRNDVMTFTLFGATVFVVVHSRRVI